MFTALVFGLMSALSFTRHTVGPLSYTHDVSAADLDGDGDIDIVAAGRSANQLVWFEWQGPDSFVPHVVYNANQVIGCWAGDLDKDGDNDLAMASGGSLMWFENDGSANFTGHSVYTPSGTGWRVNVADVDGDGDNDLLFTDWTGSTLFWFENDGAQSFTGHIVDVNLTSAHEVWGLDLDGDGDGDILATSWAANGYVYWYENDGAQNFTRHLVGNTVGSGGCWDAMPFDIDGDGDPDIAATNYDGIIVWFENDGSANWTSHIVENAFGGSLHGIGVADFNGNGYGDIVAAGYGGIVKAYEWPAWSVTNIDNLAGSLPVYPRDMDNDGDMDFVLGGNTNYWFENLTPVDMAETGSPPAPALEVRYSGAGLEVVLGLPAGTRYTLEVFSSDGRIMGVLASGTSPGSSVYMEYSLDYPRGIYYLVLKTPSAIVSSRLVR